MSLAPVIPSLPPAPVLNTGQLCDATGLSRSQIPGLVREGLPAYRLDPKTFVFIEAEAVDWLRDHGYLVDEYRASLKRLIDAAPPLTADQAARIRAVLGGVA